MTSFAQILAGEEEEEHGSSPPSTSADEDVTLTNPHRRRRWSTPVDSSESRQSYAVRSEYSDHENLESREHRGVSGINLDEYFSCSSDNSYSFYLGENISVWGPSGPPLLTGLGSNPPPQPSIAAEEISEQRRGRNLMKKRDLPPYLTTLDCNGRPRFHHRRVRSEGRLEIACVAVDLPEIVSVRGKEGLRIGTVMISDDQENN